MTTHPNAYGVKLFQAGEWAAAVDAFDAAVALAPTPAAWNNRGLARARLGDNDAALDDFAAALAYDPSALDARCNRAGLLADLGHTAAALAEYALALKAATRSDDRAAVYHDRGCVLRDAGRTDEALAEFDAALALSPDRLPTLEQRGRCRVTVGDFAGAAADFDRALSLSPPDQTAGLYHARGTLHIARKDFRAAVADYDQALDRSPDFALALLSRAQCKYHLRDRTAADDFRTAFRLDPELAARDVARMIAFDARSRPEATLKNCRQHIRLNPNDAVAHLRLGFTLRVLGHTADATAAFEVGLALAGDLADLVPQVLDRLPDAVARPAH